MALIKCPDCGQSFSKAATTCPHCGCPIKKQQQQGEGLPSDRLPDWHNPLVGPDD